ncbi:hypothetical protein CDD82_5831 [Ophiocordyceps australis]|uniref:deuterolysin n=1 Tax=Ophiocordyceps australis TaxID=1399860 RepID=A0A2C5YVE0_9HYPO|nr:hypothetical protein CDD82_5831 [Ophiocordyceps australis]
MKTIAALGTVILTAAAAPSVFKRAYVSTLGSELPDDFVVQNLHPPASYFEGNDTALEQASPSKRATVDRSCNGQRQQMINSALSGCASRAQKAAAAAKDPSNKLVLEFFKNDDQQTRQRVASVLEGVAADCGGGGKSTSIGCEQGESDQGFYGFTRFGQGRPTMQLFPLFFSLGQQGGSCGHLDSTGMILHEMTHADAETDDFSSSYGLQAIAALAPQQNIQHADTYAFFSQAVDIGCSGSDLRRGGPPSGAPAQGSPNRNRSGNSPDDETDGQTGSPTGNSPNGNSPNGNSPVGNSPTGNSPTGDSPFGNSPNGDSPFGDSPFGNPGNGNPQNGNSPFRNSPNGNSPNGDSPFDNSGNSGNGNSPFGNSPFENSPFGNSPFDNSGNQNPQGGNSPFSASPFDASEIQSEQNSQDNSPSSLPNWVNEIVSYVTRSTE